MKNAEEKIEGKQIEDRKSEEADSLYIAWSGCFSPSFKIYYFNTLTLQKELKLFFLKLYLK